MTGRDVAGRAFHFPGETAEMTARTWVERIWDREAEKLAEQKRLRAEERAQEWRKLRELMLDPKMGVWSVAFKDAEGNIVGGIL